MRSPNNPSSQTNNLRLHLQASPFSPHPKRRISDTEASLNNAKSYSLLNLTLNSTPPHQTSDQKKVFSPLPTNLRTWVANHSSLQRAKISRHHMKASRPPPNNRPPSTPYLADNTLNHILSLSSNNLQHHFPNSACIMF